jgi:ribonuclease-3
LIPDIDQFQTIIGVQFRESRLLQQALTHRSWVNEQETSQIGDNERLEFLGDAVLDFMVGDILYRRYPDMPEGDLTRLRAALVRTESLAKLAQQIHIGDFLLMGRGEEANGGRERMTNLCGAFEAFIGALYLDQGLEAVRIFFSPLLDSLLEYIISRSLDKDARSLLQEWSQSRLNITPVYHTLSATGPDHQKEFVVEVRIGEVLKGRGAGRSKQAAAQAAAREALRQVETAGSVTKVDQSDSDQKSSE